MSRPQTFSDDQIRRAIEHVHAMGETPSVTAVRALLGGGNFDRIKRLLAPPSSPPPTPQADPLFGSAITAGGDELALTASRVLERLAAAALVELSRVRREAAEAAERIQIQHEGEIRERDAHVQAVEFENDRLHTRIQDCEAALALASAQGTADRAALGQAEAARIAAEARATDLALRAATLDGRLQSLLDRDGANKGAARQRPDAGQNRTESKWSANKQSQPASN